MTLAKCTFSSSQIVLIPHFPDYLIPKKLSAESHQLQLLGHNEAIRSTFSENEWLLKEDEKNRK